MGSTASLFGGLLEKIWYKKGGQMQKDNNEKRSPLKDRPLRLPGQSVQDEINRLVDNDVIKYFMFATVFVVLAVIEWERTLQKTPPNPWVVTLIAAVVTAYCAFRIYRTFVKLRHLKLGRDGERIVAEQLDILKREGAVIFH